MGLNVFGFQEFFKPHLPHQFKTEICLLKHDNSHETLGISAFIKSVKLPGIGIKTDIKKNYGNTTLSFPVFDFSDRTLELTFYENENFSIVSELLNRLEWTSGNTRFSYKIIVTEFDETMSNVIRTHEYVCRCTEVSQPSWQRTGSASIIEITAKFFVLSDKIEQATEGTYNTGIGFATPLSADQGMDVIGKGYDDGEDFETWQQKAKELEDKIDNTVKEGLAAANAKKEEKLKALQDKIEERYNPSKKTQEKVDEVNKKIDDLQKEYGTLQDADSLAQKAAIEEKLAKNAALFGNKKLEDMNRRELEELLVNTSIFGDDAESKKQQEYLKQLINQKAAHQVNKKLAEKINKELYDEYLKGTYKDSKERKEAKENTKIENMSIDQLRALQDKILLNHDISNDEAVTRKNFIDQLIKEKEFNEKMDKLKQEQAEAVTAHENAKNRETADQARQKAQLEEANKRRQAEQLKKLGLSQEQINQMLSGGGTGAAAESGGSAGDDAPSGSVSTGSRFKTKSGIKYKSGGKAVGASKVNRDAIAQMAAAEFTGANGMGRVEGRADMVYYNMQDGGVRKANFGMGNTQATLEAMGVSKTKKFTVTNGSETFTGTMEEISQHLAGRSDAIGGSTKWKMDKASTDYITKISMGKIADSVMKVDKEILAACNAGMIGALAHQEYGAGGSMTHVANWLNKNKSKVLAELKANGGQFSKEFSHNMLNDPSISKYLYKEWTPKGGEKLYTNRSDRFAGGMGHNTGKVRKAASMTDVGCPAGSGGGQTKVAKSGSTPAPASTPAATPAPSGGSRNALQTTVPGTKGGTGSGRVYNGASGDRYDIALQGIATHEGNGGYKVYHHSGDVPTIGYGVTASAMRPGETDFYLKTKSGSIVHINDKKSINEFRSGKYDGATLTNSTGTADKAEQDKIARKIAKNVVKKYEATAKDQAKKAGLNWNSLTEAQKGALIDGAYNGKSIAYMSAKLMKKKQEGTQITKEEARRVVDATMTRADQQRYHGGWANRVYDNAMV